MEKHKFASITVVSKQSTLANFVQVLEQNSCFPLGGHYACQCVLFLVNFHNFVVSMPQTLFVFIRKKRSWICRTEEYSTTNYETYLITENKELGHK